MKIKANQIKPGMVISIKRHIKKKSFEDICLVVAIKGKQEVEYTHLDFQDPYYGLMVGTINGEQVVQVVEGKKRKFIIQEITKEIYRSLHDTENIINTLKLIEAMERK